MTDLTRYRPNQAKKLLAQSAFSISQIAEKAGYESEAVFSKAFKRELGTTPGAYRKNHSQTV